MKPPQTEAEWDAFLDEEERELLAASSIEEWREVFARQMRIRDELDDGTTYDAFEVLAEIRAELASRRTDSDRSSGAT